MLESAELGIGHSIDRQTQGQSYCLVCAILETDVDLRLAVEYINISVELYVERDGEELIEQALDHLAGSIQLNYRVVDYYHIDDSCYQRRCVDRRGSVSGLICAACRKSRDVALLRLTYAQQTVELLFDIDFDFAYHVVQHFLNVGGKRGAAIGDLDHSGAYARQIEIRVAVPYCQRNKLFTHVVNLKENSHLLEIRIRSRRSKLELQQLVTAIVVDDSIQVKRRQIYLVADKHIEHVDYIEALLRRQIYIQAERSIEQGVEQAGYQLAARIVRSCYECGVLIAYIEVFDRFARVEIELERHLQRRIGADIALGLNQAAYDLQKYSGNSVDIAYLSEYRQIEIGQIDIDFIAVYEFDYRQQRLRCNHKAQLILSYHQGYVVALCSCHARLTYVELES